MESTVIEFIIQLIKDAGHKNQSLMKNILIHCKNNQSKNEITSKNYILHNDRICKLHRNKLYKHCLNLLGIK